jgi:hypothetical protein
MASRASTWLPAAMLPGSTIRAKLSCASAFVGVPAPIGAGVGAGVDAGAGVGSAPAFVGDALPGGSPGSPGSPACGSCASPVGVAFGSKTGSSPSLAETDIKYTASEPTSNTMTSISASILLLIPDFSMKILLSHKRGIRDWRQFFLFIYTTYFHVCSGGKKDRTLFLQYFYLMAKEKCGFLSRRLRFPARAAACKSARKMLPAKRARQEQGRPERPLPLPLPK